MIYKGLIKLIINMEEFDIRLDDHKKRHGGEWEYIKARNNIATTAENIFGYLDIPIDYRIMLQKLSICPLIGIDIPTAKDIRNQVEFAMPRRKIPIIPLLIFIHSDTKTYSIVSYLLPKDPNDMHDPSKTEYCLFRSCFPDNPYQFYRDQMSYNRIRYKDAHWFNIWDCMNVILDMNMPDTYSPPAYILEIPEISEYNNDIELHILIEIDSDAIFKME